MLKPTVLKVVIAVVLGVGYYFLCANAHIDYFPCEYSEMNYNPPPEYQTGERTCSILGINRPARDPQTWERLTVGGYIVAVLSFGVVPILLGFGIGHAVRKKKGDES